MQKYKKRGQMLRLQRKTKNNLSINHIVGTPGLRGPFSDKVSSDIDGFSEEPVVRCDSPVVKNNFVDDCK